jgi:hypothetical protein
MPSGGGRNKDFYAGRDGEFANHKASMDRDLASIQDELRATGLHAAVAHVQLQSEGWAKSHRPMQKLFKPELTPLVGVSDLGELLVEVTVDGIQAIRNVVESAEPETRLVEDNHGRPVPKPSRVRSEVGALKRLRLHDATDRRKFSAIDAADWFRTHQAGDGYLLQLFEAPNSDHVRFPGEYERLESSLQQLSQPVRLEILDGWWSDSGFVWAALEAESRTSAELQELILAVLDDQPLVRRVWLPPSVATESTPMFTVFDEADGELLPPSPGQSYAAVGVIDTGIAEGVLDRWVVGRTEIVDSSLQDLSHGTFIGGLLADGGSINPHETMTEEPCQIFDLGLHITNQTIASGVYRRGLLDLIQQLDFELSAARDVGVRVFNMSLAVEELVEDDTYSPYAAAIDAIADKHDVLFVLPTGNLDEALHRPIWPTSPEAVLEMLATYRYAGQDRMYKPAESLRSITVGALEPPSGHESERPTTYSRRGPGVGFVAKPDLAHIGGSAANGDLTGLYSVDLLGHRISGCGTSYAAPLVAKSLARLDYLIEGTVERETLVALEVHGAVQPSCLESKKLRSVVRDMVGHGVPSPAADALTSDDSSITLVFTALMATRKELGFEFAWPAQLTDSNGRCRGDVNMTLVYRPPLDVNAGSEAVRVNLEAFLRQEKVDDDTGEITLEGFFKSDGPAAYERERVREGQKWAPIKRWHRRTGRTGVGNSSQWKLVVEPLARAGEALPPEGIPFTVVLTISDPSGSAPIFDEMRRALLANHVELSDIRVAQRLRPQP